MGNRANIIFTNENETKISPVVYLHWNGGPESVYQFLDELDYRKIRGAEDVSYQCARFIQLIGEFLDGDEYSSTSLGVLDSPKDLSIKSLSKIDPGDNGTYLVIRSKKRTVRRFTGYPVLKEWTTEEVEQERQSAYSDDYMKEGGFRSVYAQMHNNKPVSKY